MYKEFFVGGEVVLEKVGEGEVSYIMLKGKPLGY